MYNCFEFSFLSPKLVALRTQSALPGWGGEKRWIYIFPISISTNWNPLSHPGFEFVLQNPFSTSIITMLHMTSYLYSINSILMTNSFFKFFYIFTWLLWKINLQQHENSSLSKKKIPSFKKLFMFLFNTETWIIF